ncbi:MAG TPA: 3-oxoacyl-[acyl-carrier-protein] reductase [Clostridia bacterium]|nr:3-oxoacyl-[acyl-carrier-protein] reductase [Clostridia bacterium]
MLKGKTAVITGASRGIGKAVAVRLGKAGANLVLNYRSNDIAMDELIESLEKEGIKAVKAKGDVSNPDDAKELMKIAKDTFGSVDILVNNAGITKDKLIIQMKDEDFDSVIRINLKGSYNCIKHAAKIMMKQRSGKIINMASVVGVAGNAGQINYSASKAGVIGMTKSAARELAGRNITVNAVAPGFIETDMTKALVEKAKGDMVSGIPLGRLGLPEDVAEAVVFLASDSADYVTGQVLHVDGGMVM